MTCILKFSLFSCVFAFFGNSFIPLLTRFSDSACHHYRETTTIFNTNNVVSPKSVHSIRGETNLVAHPNRNFDDSRNLIQNISESVAITSRLKFSTGHSESSNPKTQMGTWMDNSDLEIVSNALNDVILSPSSELAMEIANSSTPVILDLCPPSNLFSFTLFHIPPFQKMPSRRHHSGTIILYKSLYGLGYLVSSINSREIQNVAMNGPNISPLFINSSFELQQLITSSSRGTILTRIGGPTRTFQWRSSSLNIGVYDMDQSQLTPAGFIELSFYPPANAGYGNSDSFTEDEKLLETDERNITKFKDLDFENINILSSYNNTKEVYQTHILASQGNMSLLQNRKPKYDHLTSTLIHNVGGLTNEINDIVRRLLASRRLKPSTLKALGLTHVRGMLLFGPPGTGKTLIAREIAKTLKSRAPKIVNGPEILDKFVGEAERNVRELFREADAEWDQMGYLSELHVIILDEIDAIAKKRGSMVGDGSGVRDSVVNQLLTMIDGVKERNNVIVIGLTNRRDLIDPALLRSGRLEVQVEIKPPDRGGREEIMYILMKPMVLAGYISIENAQAWAVEISKRTENTANGARAGGWTGAELAGLIRSAASFAVNRLDFSHQGDEDIDMTWEDFECAFEEMQAVKEKPSKREMFLRKFQEFSNRCKEFIWKKKVISSKTRIRSLMDILNDN